MKVWLYIRDIYAEFPLAVIRDRGIQESEVHYGQDPYWANQWAGEYRRDYQPEILTEFKGQKSNNMNPSLLLKRVKRWKCRKEDFGGIFYDPDTNVVLGGDEEAFRFVRLFQSGVSVDTAVRQLGVSKIKLKRFYESIWEAYNALA